MKHIFFLLLIGVCVKAVSQDTYLLSSTSSMTIEGTSTVHKWSVRANERSGTLSFNRAIMQELLFEVPVAGIKSERGPIMDTKMHTALNIEEHPKITFRVATMQIAKDPQDIMDITGILKIAGTEKEINIPSSIMVSEEKLNFNGEKTIKLRDFDIEPPTAMFGQIVVGDEVTIKFDLVFLGNN